MTVGTDASTQGWEVILIIIGFQAPEVSSRNCPMIEIVKNKVSSISSDSFQGHTA